MRSTRCAKHADAFQNLPQTRNAGTVNAYSMQREQQSVPFTAGTQQAVCDHLMSTFASGVSRH